MNSAPVPKNIKTVFYYVEFFEIKNDEKIQKKTFEKYRRKTST